MTLDDDRPLHLQVVVLAAGLGTRFGGVKQLASVGPNGEAILDLLLARAAAAGFTDAVVITSPTIEVQMRAHLDAFRPPLPVEVVLQQSAAGTADAVLSAREVIKGAFAVVNADDLYPPRAFALLAEHLTATAEPAVVVFPVLKTLIGPRPVKRALIDEDDDHRLTSIRESTVVAGELHGDEFVSMNMWGFMPSVLTTLERAVHAHAASGLPGEVLLPEVVAESVDAGAIVWVLCCDDACIGITYAEDVDVVRASLS